MAKGVFIQNPVSIYNDAEGLHYHYPAKLYQSRVDKVVGDWVVLYESGAKAREYFAVAEVQRTRPDAQDPKMAYADFVPGSYLDFAQRVPLAKPDGRYYSSLIEKSPGRPNGVAQAAVQPLREPDFWDILHAGTQAPAHLLLPREAGDDAAALAQPEVRGRAETFDYATPAAPRQRVGVYLNQWRRKQSFRARVLSAYGERCAFTGLGFVNGGGRAEVQAAHIKPVSEQGPDSVVNGLALSGTVHWMFDRGLLGLGDAGEILVSRKVNDVDSLDRLLNPDRRMRWPERESDRPNADLVHWHRRHVFER